MKVFKFIPILAVALLIPSFVAAEHSDRGRSRQYSERDHDRDSSDWSTYGRRTGHDRDYDRGHGRDYGRGYNRGRNHHTTYRRRQYGHQDDHHYDHHGYWLNAIRTGGTVDQDPVFGFRAAAPALLCNDSYYKNKFINWDPTSMKLI